MTTAAELLATVRRFEADHPKLPPTRYVTEAGETVAEVLGTEFGPDGGLVHVVYAAPLYAERLAAEAAARGYKLRFVGRDEAFLLSHLSNITGEVGTIALPG